MAASGAWGGGNDALVGTPTVPTMAASGVWGASCDVRVGVLGGVHKS